MCLVIFSLGIGMCFSCKNDALEEDMEGTSIQLKLNFPELLKTRTVTSDYFDYQINSMLFVYYENGTRKGLLSYTNANLPVNANGSETIIASAVEYFGGTVTAGNGHNLYVVCNAVQLSNVGNETWIKANVALDSETAFIDKLNTIIESGNEVVHTSSNDLYKTNAPKAKIYPAGMPMAGVVRDLQKYNECDVTRPIARLTVSMDGNYVKDSLQSILLYYYNKKCDFVEQTPPSTDVFNGFITLGTTTTTFMPTGKVLYISPNECATTVNATENEFDAGRTCVVLKVKGRKYATEYYRLDFCKKTDDSTATYLDIKRNTNYKFNINKLKIRGYQTVDECLSNPGSNIDYTVAYDSAGVDEYNGQYYVALTSATLEIGSEFVGEGIIDANSGDVYNQEMRFDVDYYLETNNTSTETLSAFENAYQRSKGQTLSDITKIIDGVDYTSDPNNSQKKSFYNGSLRWFIDVANKTVVGDVTRYPLKFYWIGTKTLPPFEMAGLEMTANINVTLGNIDFTIPFDLEPGNYINIGGVKWALKNSAGLPGGVSFAPVLYSFTDGNSYESEYDEVTNDFEGEVDGLAPYRNGSDQSYYASNKYRFYRAKETTEYKTGTTTITQGTEQIVSTGVVTYNPTNAGNYWNEVYTRVLLWTTYYRDLYDDNGSSTDTETSEGALSSGVVTYDGTTKVVTQTREVTTKKSVTNKYKVQNSSKNVKYNNKKIDGTVTITEVETSKRVDTYVTRYPLVSSGSYIPTHWEAAIGSYYQWNNPNVAVTVSNSQRESAYDGNNITISQSLGGINTEDEWSGSLPCPDGYRLPLQSEMYDFFTSTDYIKSYFYTRLQSADASNSIYDKNSKSLIYSSGTSTHTLWYPERRYAFIRLTKLRKDGTESGVYVYLPAAEWFRRSSDTKVSQKTEDTGSAYYWTEDDGGESSNTLFKFVNGPQANNNYYDHFYATTTGQNVIVPIRCVKKETTTRSSGASVFSDGKTYYYSK